MSGSTPMYSSHSVELPLECDFFDRQEAVEIENYLNKLTMERLDVLEHKRFMSAMQPMAKILDNVRVQPWEVKVSQCLTLERVWV